MRFGGVFVTMRTLKNVNSASTTYAPTDVNKNARGSPSIQPKRPPAFESAGSPVLGAGRPPATWQKPAIVTTSNPNPMPMRPLSCTEAGCRNSQPASTSNSTGMMKATRPTMPPTVNALMFAATALPMKNHSLTAPAIASTTRKNGNPSRRCSFSSDSGPNARNMPPVRCAIPIHARINTLGRSASST